MSTPRLRLGMVGGGSGAFIGAVHRMAARLDDRYVLSAGAFSSDPAVGRASGEALHVAPERIYSGFESMAAGESQRPDGIDVVAIVTPNHLHYAPARAFIERRIPVICDKPLTSDLADALALRDLVRASGVPFCVTYNYSGYPMLRQARTMVEAGELGPIRTVQLQYAQDWLAEPIEQTGQKQAAWRTDPARAGLGGSLGDIGTHIVHLAGFVSGLPLQAVSADLSSFGPGRVLDDNAHLLLRFADGAKGMLWTSQIAYGHANDLVLRLYGERGALEWRHDEPEILAFTRKGGPTQRLQRGAAPDRPAPTSRLPGGHPEGYVEAFATLYAEFADQVSTWRAENVCRPGLVPTVEDGVDGMRFVEAAVRSSRNGGAWTRLA